ncbi:MAG: tetratricopeptide repeat protein [Chlorobium sp.]|jgi:tetratricopeptide (TPR) repeat protein|nr:tetratricopeptide repeat protein [Chlorobium sp.]
MLKDAMGGYRGTACEISRIILEHPENADAWYNRGNDRASCGEFDAAVSDYTMALKLGLRFREAVNAYGNRAMARVETGDLDGAIEDFSEIIVRKPKNLWMLRTAYLNRALLRENKGDIAGAMDDRRLAVLLSPTIKTQ